MRVVWVLTVLHLIGGTGIETNSMQTVETHASDPREPRYEQITIGFYDSKVACTRMRDQVSTAPGFKPGSAQCRKEVN